MIHLPSIFRRLKKSVKRWPATFSLSTRAFAAVLVRKAYEKEGQPGADGR